MTIEEAVRSGYTTMKLPGWSKNDYLEVRVDAKGKLQDSAMLYGSTKGEVDLGDYEGHNEWMPIGVANKELAQKLQKSDIPKPHDSARLNPDTSTQADGSGGKMEAEKKKQASHR